MTTAEKLEISAREAAQSRIVLFREGNFLKAYDESAYLFVTRIKSYQVNRVFVKTVGREVFSLGFPSPSLDKILAGFNYRLTAAGNVSIALCGDSFSDAEFLKWREAVKVQPRPAKHSSAENLQGFKSAYSLLLAFYRLNSDICREYKFSLSEKIKDNLTAVLLGIYELNEPDVPAADSRTIKKDVLKNLRAAKIGVRLLYDLKQLPLKKYTGLAKEFAILHDLLSKDGDSDGGR